MFIWLYLDIIGSVTDIKLTTIIAIIDIGLVLSKQVVRIEYFNYFKHKVIVAFGFLMSMVDIIANNKAIMPICSG